MILIDTDVLVDASRGMEQARECLREIEQRSSSAISVVIRMELIVGCRNKRELRAVERMLRRFTVIPLDARIGAIAADLLTTFHLSHGLLIPDALIAATAIAQELPFMSRNLRDFRFIPNLDLRPYPNPFGQ